VEERARLLIDTDGGIDDALALLLALRTSQARVEAITTVFGNVDVGQAACNVNYVLELCDQHPPVFLGSSKPMRGRRMVRASSHGRDGLGDLGLRPVRTAIEAEPAHEEIIRQAREAPGALTILTLGPLTNLARALSAAPDLSRLFHRAVVMGGAVGPGSATPRAEFNIWSDPAAARFVFTAGLPLTLIPIDVSRGEVALTLDDQARLEEIDTRRSRFAASMIASSMGARGRFAGAPDMIAAAIGIDPGLIRDSRRLHVDVETRGELTRGETVFDETGLSGQPPNADLVIEIDPGLYRKMIDDACR
jgi:inosine-uridine nucleoside N-ribohydrolase